MRSLPYKLNLEWSDDQTELMIVDKKAQIREALQIVTVPGNMPRVHSLDGESDPQGPAQSRLPPETVAFQVSCMKQLTEEESKVPAKKSVEEQLSTHDPKYQALIKKYPQLLNPDFVKGEPVHGVYHRIDTGSHAPCKAKRRPIIMDSAKAAAGKAAWEQWREMGSSRGSRQVPILTGPQLSTWQVNQGAGHALVRTSDH